MHRLVCQVDPERIGGSYFFVSRILGEVLDDCDGPFCVVIRAVENLLGGVGPLGPMIIRVSSKNPRNCRDQNVKGNKS